ncbi:MAG: class II aldolase/adducin family protein [Chloroflexota bacterium]|nr:class II aldolase/adducin family protein [Chloroflexota bacterium]MDE2970234.1 class II aldolase/adducin family protein [Chloroflexota bacterium]
MAEIDDVKREVAIANRILTHTGLSAGILASLGHVSMRVPGDPELFVVKGRGYEVDALPLMQPEDMIVCDMEGRKVGGPPNATQCFEVKIHSTILKAHPEINSAVHVHPRFATMMSVLQARLVPMCNEGRELVRRPIGVYPHNKLILTEEDGQGVVAALGDAQVALLRGHGAVTVGRSVDQSVMNMLQLEEQARMNWYAYCAMGPDHPGIPEDDIVEALSQPSLSELEHFQGGPAPRQGGAGPNGAWLYFKMQVEQELDAVR